MHAANCSAQLQLLTGKFDLLPLLAYQSQRLQEQEHLIADLEDTAQRNRPEPARKVFVHAGFLDVSQKLADVKLERGRLASDLKAASNVNKSLAKKLTARWQPSGSSGEVSAISAPRTDMAC